MPLQGTFDVLDFSEVMRLLARQGLTGRLHVRSRSFGANLFLEDGALVGADQSEHQAAAAAGDVRGRVEEICFELLDAERGTFEFQPGRHSALPAPTRLKVDTVLTRARKRLEEWQELQEALPSLDVSPRLADDLESAEVTIDQERWRVLTVIDGRRNLRAIGRTLALSDFDVCRIVKSLLDEGVVELDVRNPALASTGRDSSAPITTTATELRPAGTPNGHAGSDPAAAPSASAPVAPPAPAPSSTATKIASTRSPSVAANSPTAAEPAAAKPPAAKPPAARPALSIEVVDDPRPPSGEPADGRSDSPGSNGAGAATSEGAADVTDVTDEAGGRRRRVVRIRSRSKPDQ